MPISYDNNDIVFLDNKIGIILNGNVIVKNHEKNLLNPEISAKYNEGDILGHSL